MSNSSAVCFDTSGVPWITQLFQNGPAAVLPTLHCENFPVNHLYFQIANVFFLLSHFAPAGNCGIIYLRLMLLIGCGFFAVWGLEILCSFDVLIWNLTFVLCNLVYILVLLVRMWPIRFTKEIEEVSS